MSSLPTPRYTLLEDVQGVAVSTIMSALGIHLLRTAGLVTGGTAGLALLLGYATGLGFGLLFFVVNLPFYIFAYLRKGLAFTVKSFVTVTAVSLIASALPGVMDLRTIDAPVAAVLFGVVAGVGLLGLFRHAASLGGVSIVALIVQDRWGYKAGWVLLAYDSTLFLISFAVLPAERVLWSMLGAVVLNGVIMMNHRRDWYVAA